MDAVHEVDERRRHDSTRVAAVVLTHDAPDALERCLTALDAQVSPVGAVLVTDCASTTPVDDVIRRFARVGVRRLPENLGPAGGYAEALTAFLDTGFEWAWVMDDDCVPVPDALARQLSVAEADRVVLSTAQWDETGTVVRGHGWWGALIHRSVIETVGVPNPELFWWTEDTEYLQWRIPKAGIEVRWTEQPVTRVSRGRPDDAKPVWKYYYEARNQVYHRLWVQRPDRLPLPRPKPKHLRVSVRCWRATRAVALLTVRAVVREHEDRLPKIAAIARGTADGVRGRLGATVVPDTAHRPSVRGAGTREPERSP